jgi:hypothetical protein
MQEPRLLPVATLNGQEFLVDIENRQFRNFNNSDEVIRMHSERGRKVVRDMQGSEWCRRIAECAAESLELVLKDSGAMEA